MKEIKKEYWKDIPGYEGMYQCSTYGNVRSLDRYIQGHSGKYQFKKGQDIIPRKNKNGYLQFALNKDSERKMVYVHIIIAETFLKKDNLCKCTVNHKDGNKINNSVDNLEWCSYSQNNKHAYDELHRNVSKEGARRKEIYFIDTKTKSMKYYESIAEASRSIKLSHTQINRYIHSDKKWKGRYIILTDNNKSVEDIEKVS